MRESQSSGALTETTFLVLLALYQPNHGYGVMQYIEQETEGRVTLGPGTLYGAINTLLRKKWIAPFGPEDGRRKQYQITPLGKEQLQGEIARIRQLYHSASRIVEEGEQ